MNPIFAQATGTPPPEPPPAGPGPGPEHAGPEAAGLLQKFIDTFVSMGESAVAKAPYILIGIAIFVIGFILAKIIRAIVAASVRKVGLDTVAEKVGLPELLAKIGVRAPLSKFISKLLYYILIIIFLKVAADFMGIEDLSAFIDNLIAFIPKLLVAFLILLAGLLAAEVIRGMTRTALDKVGIEYSGLIANFLYGLLAVMILTVVLGQIGIETDLLNAAVKIFLAAGALAVALSLGLGLRPVAANVVSGVYARDTFHVGAVVEIEEKEATVIEVGPVSTRLETADGEYFVIPNSKMVSELVKGRDPRESYLEKTR